MSNSAFMDNLRQLFAECDHDQSGSLGPDEFKELCAKIGLSRDMADETFKRLDIDQDSQITFDEFAAGFKQYKEQQQQAKPNGGGQTGGANTPPRFTQTRPTSSPVTRRARSRTSTGANGANSLGSTGSSGNLTSGRSTSSSGANDATSRCFSSTDLSCDQDQRQHQQAADDVIVYASEQLLADQSCGSGQFGSMMSSNGSLSQMKTMQDLLECVQKLQNENQILTQIFFKDKREREEYISQLGEEFDQQLREVEERANRRAREELELEKKRLKDMMHTERETLQHHYQTLEKISKMVKSSAASGKPLDGEGFTKVKSQLEDTFIENRQLKKSLMDTKTDVALIWKEMEKLKKHYEDKLSNAYEKQRETQHECDHIKLQLNLMKDSNRKLQDASDVITNYITDKVEPVIKVAMDSNDDSNETNSLNPIQQQRSASNSRRGSILSEYLIDNDRDDIDDDAIESSISLCSNMGGSSQAAAAAAVGEASQSSLLKRMNGLEVSLSRNQRFNQSTTSTSTTASDSHFLTVSPSTAAIRTKIKPGDRERDSTDKGVLDAKANPISGQAKIETIAQIVPKISLPPTKLNEQKPAMNKLAGSGGEQTQPRSSLKSIGRHFMLGSRSQSDAKPKESVKDLNEAKSMSADQADEPLIEPSDGPSVGTFNIILVGDSFVGKSSFAARFIEGNFVQGLISNCSIDFKTKSYKVDGINYTVNLWDTAGQERFRSITASYFRKADGIILMYDVTDKRSYLNVRNWMSTIADTAAENVAVLLVGNKIDLRINDNKPNCVPTEEGFRLAREYNIVFLETSVKTGTNLLPSMGKLIRLIAKNNTPEDADNDRIKLSDKARTFNCMPKNC